MIKTFFMKYTIKLFVLFSFFAFAKANAQNNTSYWQQHVDYKMEIDMDVDSYQYDW